MSTTSSQRLLAGLVPANHRVHRVPSTGLVQLCPSCHQDNLRREPAAALLRAYGDGWGNVDVELLMRDLAEVGDPQILQDFFPSEL